MAEKIIATAREIHDSAVAVGAIPSQAEGEIAFFVAAEDSEGSETRSTAEVSVRGRSVEDGSYQLGVLVMNNRLQDTQQWVLIMPPEGSAEQPHLRTTRGTSGEPESDESEMRRLEKLYELMEGLRGTETT